MLVEDWVAKYLEKNNCRILERNFLCRLGEVDLILDHIQSQSLVFVEVRFRKNQLFGGPLASIDWKKQRKLIRTAEYYLKQKPHFQKMSCRFDVVGVTMDNNGALKLEWVQNAFQAG